MLSARHELDQRKLTNAPNPQETGLCFLPFSEFFGLKEPLSCSLMTFTLQSILCTAGIGRMKPRPHLLPQVVCEG
jgi:hypothetical protein